MKQSSSHDSPVTKDVLIETLKNYPTKQDLSTELDERFSNFHNAFRAEMDHKFLLFEEHMERKFSHFTNLILTAIDPLLKELETRQQDREIATAQIKKAEDDIKNLDKRVTKLEHS